LAATSPSAPVRAAFAATSLRALQQSCFRRRSANHRAGIHCPVANRLCLQQRFGFGLRLFQFQFFGLAFFGFQNRLGNFAILARFGSRS